MQIIFRNLAPSEVVKASINKKAEKLLQAAKTLFQQPQALQLRYLQTLTEIAGECSNTIVFPQPIDLFDSLTGAKKPS